MNAKPIVGITMGDPAGNGPEITVKALAHAEVYDSCRPIVVGDVKIIEQAARFVGRPDITIHRCEKVSDARFQQGVIDGAENNELALTNNKHGEVAKYYSYNKHQMVPDMLVANLKFLNSLSPEDYQVFKEAAALSTEVEMEEWDKSIEEAKKIATDEMGVEFIDVDVEAFKEKVLPLHESMLQENEKIRDLYDHIQAANEKAKGGQ